MEREVWRDYYPNKVVVLSAAETSESILLLQAREKIDDKATAYIYENFVCQKPVKTTEELREQLSQLNK